MQLTPTRLFDVGLDWLTITSKQKNHGILLASHADHLVHDELVRGAISVPFSRSGYQGFKVGHIGVGIRPEDCIVRLSGPLAQQHWREFAHLVTNCSRIDLQVTAAFEHSPAAIISKVFNCFKKKSRKQKGGPTVSLWSEVDGGSTCYLGKRSSERFARVYDKGSESGSAEYAGAVRFEVEVKGDLAWKFWSELKTACHREDGPYPTSAELAIVRNAVVDYFSGKGLQLELELDAPSLLRSGRSKSDVGRRLAWLNASVSIAVDELISRGFAREVIEHLLPNTETRGKLLEVLQQMAWSKSIELDHSMNSESEVLFDVKTQG